MSSMRSIGPMLTYDFMVNAFAASGIVALLAGVVGFFLVLRGQTFAADGTRVTPLLCGNILGVDGRTVWYLVALASASLLALACIARPLLFASLQPELAEAKGVSLPLVSLLFLAIVALTVAECAQIVGILLVFTLMVGPAAAAARLSTRLGWGGFLAAGLAPADAWTGLPLAYYTAWPAGSRLT